MHKWIFVLFSLFFTSYLFATAANMQTNIIKENKSDENKSLVQENIETEELSFQEKSAQEIKKLLKSKKAPRFFVSRKTLKRYYKDFDYTLIWIDENGVKEVALTLLDTIKNDPVLKPHAKKAFKLDRLIKSLNSLDKSPDKYLESMTKIDFMLVGIYNKYMGYLSKGFINWKTFKKQLKELDEEKEILADWEKYNVRKNVKKLLLEAIDKNDLSIAFNAVNFTYPKAKELADIIVDYERIALNGGYTKLPKFKVLKEGVSDPTVKILRERLVQSNDLVLNECQPVIKAEDIVTNTTDISTDKSNIIINGSETIESNCYDIYDQKVKEAVISFQKSHGLLADGIAGPTTRKYLNIPIEKKIIQMRLNLERMRWLPRTLGEKYLLVNIPEYKLKMYENGEVKLDMPIVVGKRTHPTPIFSNKMSFVVLNPYWRIPQRIVKREILPKILENPTYLDGKGINIHENWDHESTQFDVNSIDWTPYIEKKKDELSEIQEVTEVTENLPTYRFIQVPSDQNPLGRMKFMFPNKYSVYLHDTPAKKYFKYTKRAYSHGCVRLGSPKELLKAIASKDKNLDFEEANEVLKDINKTQIGLNRKIPVHMVYLTSWIDENGKIQFRDDVYKYDRMQRKLLYKKNQFM